MANVLTEGLRTGESIVYEEPAFRSRKAAIILSGEGELEPNTVLGRVAGAVTQAFAGTGNGVLTPDVTTPKLAGVQEGAYRLVCIEPAANGGTFSVFDPKGVHIGTVAVGGTFATQIKFVIADGATDFVAGDAFSFIVAEGTKYRAADPTATDGSAVARAVLYAGVDATDADAACVIVYRNAVVNAHALAFDAALNTDNEKATAYAELALQGIDVRS